MKLFGSCLLASCFLLGGANFHDEEAILKADDECSLESGSCALNALQRHGSKQQVVGGGPAGQVGSECSEPCGAGQICVTKADKSWSQCVPSAKDDYLGACRYWDPKLRAAAAQEVGLECTSHKCFSDDECLSGRQCVAKEDGSWSQCIPKHYKQFKKECVKWNDDFRLAAIKATNHNCPDSRCYSHDWCVHGHRCARQKDGKWGQCISCKHKTFQYNCYSWTSDFAKAAHHACGRRCLHTKEEDPDDMMN
eukprot:TRINITY_DN9673_c0_g1_i1.p1 TRINITY_DN9673_c0_g1~~TRINITY_DN9673_c0_g1_i1.p1  ORF type:complete len:251 (+),score=45.64 TRINITY_DN9673_c0_g1_i1:228-980(+)